MEGAVIWMLIAIAAGVIDALTSNFFFVIFSVGAVAASIMSALHIPFGYQIIVFAVISLLLMIFAYPIMKKKYKADVTKTPLMEENYIGMVMTADQDIVKNVQLKVGGEYWTAVNNGDVIYKGDKFSIIGIEGIKLIIKKIVEG